MSPPAAGGGETGNLALTKVLERSAARGFLGPRSLEDQLEHARGFASATSRAPTSAELACDLGSGGGIPGLVLAAEVWPESRWVLLEGMAKRCELLLWAVAELDIGDRVTVVHGRVEHVGRPGQRLRGACTLVTSRSFGPPRVTAEAAAPLLLLGGTLVVSEPPGSDGERWPETGLAPLGLHPTGVVRTERAGYMVLTQERPCPGEFPRPWKRQTRQPLF
ncbi:MAG: rRNA small subunit 7-methylguanosine (m7G) methyltransferase GidB [uncultured Acidimicrobiales bacterium]|uniref:Glucose-inhibited division protein B n=1 Tax=uncultured Acidimicrobiales bacterium TaxID=310071 RepID=A0A6J4IDW2_9ACTN|nr:MAG: rRNA small subunit 7-methylguanosine (m7G) methyltransferase GidB [uncultured Acidimicrobiales bacterium]